MVAAILLRHHPAIRHTIREMTARMTPRNPRPGSRPRDSTRTGVSPSKRYRLSNRWSRSSKLTSNCQSLPLTVFHVVCTGLSPWSTWLLPDEVAGQGTSEASTLVSSARFRKSMTRVVFVAPLVTAMGRESGHSPERAEDHGLTTKSSPVQTMVTTIKITRPNTSLPKPFSNLNRILMVV